MPDNLLLNGIELNLIHPAFELAVSQRIRREGLASNVPFASKTEKDEAILRCAQALGRLFLTEPQANRIVLLAEVIRAGWAIQDGENFKPSIRFANWQSGVLVKALDMARIFDQVLPAAERIRQDQLFAQELHVHQRSLEQIKQGSAQYLRYVHGYDVVNDSFLSPARKDALNSEVIPDWLRTGEGLSSLQMVPDTFLVPTVQPLPVGIITGKAVHVGGDRWRLEYDATLLEELESANGWSLLTPLKHSLAQTLDDMDGIWTTWLWALDVPSCSNPKADFEKRCGGYWEARLELDVLKKAARKAKKLNYSSAQANEFAVRERAKFLARYSSVANAIVNVQSKSVLTEWDVTLAAAWLKACIRCYPSVSKAFEWKYQGEGQGNWYDNWLSDLPTVVLDSLAHSPLKFKNVAQVHKSHIAVARGDFRKTFKPTRTYVETKKQRGDSFQDSDSIETGALPESHSTLDDFVDSEMLNQWCKLLSSNEQQIFDLLRDDASLNSTQLSHRLGRPAGQIRVEKKRLLDKIKNHVKQSYN